MGAGNKLENTGNSNYVSVEFGVNGGRPLAPLWRRPGDSVATPKFVREGSSSSPLLRF
jgi:hypothetical protein